GRGRGGGPASVGRRGKVTQAAATPFAAAERGRRRISEELGGETLPRTRPGLSDLLGTARSHASPLGPLGGVAAPAAADTPRIGVGNAGRLPSPPCPRIKDNKADVILKYNADEARSLKAYGELPEHAKINETDTFGPGDDDEIQFDDIGDDDEDIDDI
uniref:Eukaryotic translation initiation factor 1A n=1 Tax=Ailuropoda melanoleuca TaxID=9646 RepID=A0A7N5K5F2_AILME